jgi:glycine cleavage system H protein
MDFPENLYYTKDHEWLSSLSGTAKVGVSSYAIEQLGDIVHIDLPAVGASFSAHDSFGTIESTKTVSDLYMPAAGKVVAVNEAIASNPQSLQDDPYKNGWLVKIELTRDVGKANLLDSDQYESYIQEEE